MLKEKAELVSCLIVWLLANAVVVVTTVRATYGTGLVLGYLFQMFLLYGAGALIHALPWSDLPQTDQTLLGFVQATYGMCGFMLGQQAGGFLGSSIAGSNTALYRPARDLPGAYLKGGFLFMFLLNPLVGAVPSLGALTNLGMSLVLVGCCLSSFRAYVDGGMMALKRWLGYALAIPIFTMLTMGFLGYGVVAVSVIVLFISQFFRPRWILAAGFCVATYAGLSFYVAYMGGRDALREAVWRGGSWQLRVERLMDTVLSIRPFDPFDDDQLMPIDGRLNQNYLTGAAVVHMRATQDFAHGETIVSAFAALVPRLIWPGKPLYAGSGNLVTRFTGIEFAAGTSVGIGAVLELFANFGGSGVFLGFIVLGFLITLVDRLAGSSLMRGDWRSFASLFLLGLAMLQVGGVFSEVTSTGAASVIVGQLMAAALEQYQKRVRKMPASARGGVRVSTA